MTSQHVAAQPSTHSLIKTSNNKTRHKPRTTAAQRTNSTNTNRLQVQRSSLTKHKQTASPTPIAARSPNEELKQAAQQAAQQASRSASKQIGKQADQQAAQQAEQS
jgi:hypothetical protein